MKLKLSVMAVVMLLTNGCALFNPYVQPRPPSKRDVTPPVPEATFAGNMGDAVRHADQWRTAYIRAAGVHSTTRNVSAAAIIPLTATSLFYGMTDHGSSDRITRMALGSAALFGANEFLTSKPRQQVYLAGASALTCAIVSSRPYLVTDKWLTGMEAHTDTMIAGLATLEEKRARLREMITTAEETGGKTTSMRAAIASAKRTEADAALASQDAGKLRDKAVLLAMRIRQSGQELLGVVRAINDRVNLEVSKTEPNMQALKAIVSSTGGLAGELVDAASPKASSEAGKPAGSGEPLTRYSTDARNVAQRAETDLINARNKVIDAQANLASAGSRLLADLHAVSALEQTSKVLDCVPTEKVVTLTVLPAGDAIKLKVGDPFLVSADGGTGWLKYKLTGPKTSTLNISALDQRASSLVLMISAKETIAAGQGPTLTIMDDGGSVRKNISLSAE